MEPRIRASLATGLPEFLRSYRVDFPLLARGAGLDPETMRDPNAYLSLAAFARLLETAAAATGDAALGLKAGLALRVGATGAVGYAIVNAPTVGAALETMARYGALLIDAAQIHFIVEPSGAIFEWNTAPSVSPRAQYVDYITAIIVMRMRRLIGAQWMPYEVALTRRAPRDREPYLRHLSHRLVFDADQNRIVFTREVLEQRCLSADPALHAVLVDYCEKLLAERPRQDDLVSRVRDRVARDLERSRVELEGVARALGVSPRTLQRRLAEEGTSFADLVDDIRHDLARRYLLETGLTIAEIGYKLGFASPGAFTRAARRWFGENPRRVRAGGGAASRGRR